MFSSNLEESPNIEMKGMQVVITITGYDDEGIFSEVRLVFDSVIEF